MKHVIACMRALCPISDETVKELESLVVKCNYPKRYQLIKENIFCRYAYFIEKGMTRSFWLVDGEELRPHFRVREGLSSVWTNSIIIKRAKNLLKHWKT